MVGERLFRQRLIDVFALGDTKVMKKRKTTPNGTAPEGEPDGSLDALDSLAAEMEQAAEDESPDSADDADGESFEIP